MIFPFDMNESEESFDQRACHTDGFPPRSQLLVSSSVAEMVFPEILIPAPTKSAFCLLLKVFQSVDERAPVDIAEARASEIC